MIAGILLDEPRVSWRKAALTSLGLCAIFVLAYGGTNLFSAWRDVQRSMAFGWEHYIPFTPVMLVPYMSIDLLFVAAPLLCRDEQELRVLGRRVGLSVIIASFCFLLFPLKFSFPRPAATGLLGHAFDGFHLLDRPYNQLPSLHMALRTILAAHYARHLHTPWRWTSNMWFSLIGFSTVLTYQHHFIDLPSGILLGAVCLYLIPDQPTPRRPASNVRVGRRYAAVATFFAVATILLFALTPMPWQSAGVVTAYLAISPAAVAFAYFRWGATAYRKNDGRLHWTAKALLAPMLLAQWLSLQHYARKSERWNEITDRVWLGRHLTPRDAADLPATAAILDLTCEFCAFPRKPGTAYLNVPVLDLTAPSDEELAAAMAFIDKHSKAGVVYVHCKAGFSRSAAVVGAYLISRGHTANADAAAALLRSKRPGIVLRPEVLAVLHSQARATRPS